MSNRVPTAHFPDISHFEIVDSFHAVAAGGCPLVITKATESTGYVDPTYAGFAARIRSVPGLILGAYVFEHTGVPAAAQISHFLSVAHLQRGDLQPVVDAEQLGLTRAETFAALTALEARGYRPILYCSLSFFQDTLRSPVRWWLWLAAYRNNLPALPDEVNLFAWQHDDAAIFPGVKNPCDASYLYVPVADLLTKFCIT
jgi:GH25 family lysozyme M1 (1,4-beta-N-acetylmuramidase)